MADNPKVDLLHRVPLFARCSGDSMGLIGRLADEVDVPDGYVLMRQGDRGREFFLIVEGRVRIERDGVTIATLGPGDYLGEIALLDEGPRTATATAEGPVRLFVITHQGFNSLLDSSTDIRTAILESVASRLRTLESTAGG